MSRGRKILFVSSNFPPVIGGSAVVYDQICRCLSQHVVGAGASRDYKTGEEWPDLSAGDRDRDYIVHRTPYLRPPIIMRPRGRLARVIAFITRDSLVMARTLSLVIALIFRYRVTTVCLGELVSNGWLVFPLRYLLRRRVLIYTHGEEISQSTDGMFGRMRRAFLRHAHGIISVSLFCKGQIVSKFGIDPARVRVVSNGVDLGTFKRGDRDRSWLPERLRSRRIILSVGRLVERKGQEQLLLALPKILVRIPDAHCVVVGDGPLAAKIRDAATDLGLSDACTFRGSISQEELVRLYQVSDIFCLPCRTLPDGDTEGFGLVFLEANACGLPVVAGAAGGTIEAVVDGETGLLVNGGDIDDIADSVARVLSDQSLARRLAEVGWRRAQQYSWQSAAEEFLRVCLDGDNEGPNRPYQASNLVVATQSASTGRDNNLIPRLLLTIDVEEEFAWHEFRRDRHIVRGADALAEFHNGLREIGVRPVYLVTYPIMCDGDFRRLFRTILAEEAGEVGIHPHSWTTPPYWEEPNVFTSYQCNLPEHVERRKLEFLSRTYEDCFGRAVTVHRAGRWGGSERTSKLLDEIGITVDLSPSVGYSDPMHAGPDFTYLDGSPFWSGPRSNVLTVPASAINNLRGPQWVSNAFFAARKRSAAVHLLDEKFRIGKPVRFSPESNSVELLISMVREFRSRAVPVCVFTLHSTSLYGGGNPYSQTEAAARALRSRAITTISQCLNEGLLRPSTCAEIYKETLLQASSGDRETRAKRA